MHATIMQIVNIFVVVAFFIALAVVSFCDIKTRTIPDIWCGVILTFAIARVLCGGIHWTTSAISCVAVGFITLLIAIIKFEALGGGDVKLCAVAAAFSGGEAFIYAITIGLLVVVFMQGKKEKVSIPLAPYLSIGYGAFYLITILKGVI